jgi:hypothetical protein
VQEHSAPVQERGAQVQAYASSFGRSVPTLGNSVHAVGPCVIAIGYCVPAHSPMWSRAAGTVPLRTGVKLRTDGAMPQNRFHAVVNTM